MREVGALYIILPLGKCFSAFLQTYSCEHERCLQQAKPVWLLI